MTASSALALLVATTHLQVLSFCVLQEQVFVALVVSVVAAIVDFATVAAFVMLEWSTERLTEAVQVLRQ